MSNIYQHKPLQERQDAPQVLNSSVPAKDDASSEAKRNVACRSGNTWRKTRGRMSAHEVFVLSKEGKTIVMVT